VKIDVSVHLTNGIIIPIGTAFVSKMTFFITKPLKLQWNSSSMRIVSVFFIHIYREKKHVSLIHPEERRHHDQFKIEAKDDGAGLSQFEVSRSVV